MFSGSCYKMKGCVYKFLGFSSFKLQGAFPNMVNVRNLERTHEGRQIKLVHVSLNPSQKSNRPAVLMDCGIHAR